MDIPAGGVLPRALQAQLALAPPPAAVLPAPLAAGAVEALVVAARPAPGPTASWSLELEIDGERVQMSSATLLAACDAGPLARAVAANGAAAAAEPAGSSGAGATPTCTEPTPRINAPWPS